MNVDDTQLREGAQRLIEQAKALDRQGDNYEAARLQERAERLYEEAGLDPTWHDNRSILVKEAACADLNVYALGCGQLELSDDPDPTAEPSGVFCVEDDLVDAPR